MLLLLLGVVHLLQQLSRVRKCLFFYLILFKSKTTSFIKCILSIWHSCFSTPWGVTSCQEFWILSVLLFCVRSPKRVSSSSFRRFLKASLKCASCRLTDIILKFGWVGWRVLASPLLDSGSSGTLREWHKLSPMDSSPKKQASQWKRKKRIFSSFLFANKLDFDFAKFLTIDFWIFFSLMNKTWWLRVSWAVKRWYTVWVIVFLFQNCATGNEFSPVSLLLGESADFILDSITVIIMIEGKNWRVCFETDANIQKSNPAAL